MLNHKLWLVLQVDLPTCWNTRRTSGGCVGLLFAQTTPNRMICMNEVMKLTVDDTSLHLSSNRTTIFVIWILMWCVKWMIVMVGQSRHACRCPGGTPLRFFFLFSSSFSTWLKGMLAVSAITFGEKLHLEKCATSCTTLFNRCIWTSRFLISNGK